MRKIIVLLVIGLFCFQNMKAHVHGHKPKGIQFFHGSYNELLKEAKKQNKKIFIDFYTKWCGPCKAMAKNVFPLKEVGDFYNKHFICYKIDAEVGEGPALAKKYKVRGYPTFVYANADGGVIKNGSSMGAGDADGFIRLAKLALGLDKKDWAWYQEEYKKGNRENKFLKGYYNARMAETHRPMQGNDYWEFYQSFPKSERFGPDASNLVFWQSKPGNKFYEILTANKNKFSQLKDAKQVVAWASGLMGNVRDDAKRRELQKTLKKDLPKYIDQAIEYYEIDKLRFSMEQNELEEHMDRLTAYKDKYGTPLQYEMIFMMSAPRIKNIKPKYALEMVRLLQPRIDEGTDHFYSVSMYCYMLYKAGKKEESRGVSIKFKDLTEQYKTNKKMAKYYTVMKAIEEGKQPTL